MIKGMALEVWCNLFFRLIKITVDAAWTLLFWNYLNVFPFFSINAKHPEPWFLK